MKPSKIRNLIAAVLVIGLALTGCQPPAYTAKAQKQITQDHERDGIRWFEENYPQAKAAKAEALADGTDLFCAVKGNYVLEKQSLSFIYDYESDVMYLEHLYRETTALMEERLAGLLQQDPARMQFGWWTSMLSIPTANDKKEKSMGSYAAKNLLPWGTDPQSCAELCLTEDAMIGGFATVFTEEIPEPDRILDLGLTPRINYIAPSQPDGSTLYARSFDDAYEQGTAVCSSHLKQLADGLYAGILCHLETCPEGFDAKMVCETELEISLPAGCVPVVFAKKQGKNFKAVQLVSSGSQTKEVELKEMHESEALLPGMMLYNAGLGMSPVMLPEDLGLSAFEVNNGTHPAEGTYHIVLKWE